MMRSSILGASTMLNVLIQHLPLQSLFWTKIWKAFRASDPSTHHKARLVAHGLTLAYGIDYAETFSPIVHLHFVHVLLSLTINQAWLLYQLYVSNAFLFCDLEEQVFVEQALEYVAQGVSSKVCFL